MSRAEPVLGPSARRAIDYLRTLPERAECSTSGLLDALPGTKLVPLLRDLEHAVGAGAIFRRKREPFASAPWWWSLTDHPERRALPSPLPDLPPKPPVSTWSPTPFPPERRTLARAPTPVAQSAPTPPQAQPAAVASSGPQPASDAPGVPDIQPRRRSSAPKGLTGDPGRLASAAARASLSTPPAPSLSETQAATPSGELRICMWHDGTLEVWDAQHRLARFEPEQTLQLADYFGAIGTGDS